jgi:2-octaprenyl-6-methoxyphenol hydroxylase
MKKYDVVIAGAGHIGTSIAVALAGLGLKICVFDRKPDIFSVAERRPARLLALAGKSCEIMDELGIIEDMSKLGQAINIIRVLDYNSNMTLTFDPQEVYACNFGYMVQEDKLLQALYDKLRKCKNVECLSATEIQEVDTSARKVIFTDNKEIKYNLLIAADGKFSEVRDWLGIETSEKHYEQKSLIADVKHELPHNGAAIEMFCPKGPFAMLPNQGGHITSIVWTDTHDTIDAFLAASPEIQQEAIAVRFGDWLGKIELQPGMAAFPLSKINAKSYIGEHAMLAGDAAHAMHPIAGQGFNLGLRDVEYMYELISNNLKQGLPLTYGDTLYKYNKQRRRDAAIMLQGCDTINAVFSNQLPFLTSSRRVGISIVDRFPLARKFFMRYAMGYVGSPFS